jgi:Na+/proline symporter
MVNSSALAAHNLYRTVFRPEASDREVLAVGRVCGLFLVAGGVVLAQSLTGVANALTTLLGFSSIMGVVVWGGVLWKRANAKGAWAAVIVLFGYWAVFGPLGMIARERMGLNLPAYVGMFGREKYVFELMMCYLPIGVTVFIIVSLLTPPLPAKRVNDFFKLLRTPVGREQELIDAGVPITYIGSSTASPLETKYPKLVHWGGFALAAVICVGIFGLLILLARIGG